MLDEKWVFSAFEHALRFLLKFDEYLLEHNVHERSIVHRLAMYLQLFFCSYHVDVEYNRKAFSTGKTDVKKTTGEKRRVYPDIIVHKRGKDKNLLAVELKKSSSRSYSRDIEKLEEYLSDSDLGYQFAVFVELNLNGRGRISQIKPSGKFPGRLKIYQVFRSNNGWEYKEVSNRANLK